MGISSLNASTPLGGTAAGGGAAELRDLKAAIRASFPGFASGATEVCTSTGPQIDSAVANSSTRAYANMKQNTANYTFAITTSYQIMSNLLGSNGPTTGDVTGNTGTGRITVGSSGNYRVTFSGRVSGGFSGATYTFLAALSRSGSTSAISGFVAACQTAGTTISTCGGGFSVSGILAMTAGQYLELMLRAGAAAASGEFLLNDFMLTVERV